MVSKIDETIAGAICPPREGRTRARRLRPTVQGIVLEK